MYFVGLSKEVVSIGKTSLREVAHALIWVVSGLTCAFILTGPSLAGSAAASHDCRHLMAQPLSAFTAAAGNKSTRKLLECERELLGTVARIIAKIRKSNGGIQRLAEIDEKSQLIPTLECKSISSESLDALLGKINDSTELAKLEPYTISLNRCGARFYNVLDTVLGQVGKIKGDALREAIRGSRQNGGGDDDKVKKVFLTHMTNVKTALKSLSEFLHEQNERIDFHKQVVALKNTAIKIVGRSAGTRSAVRDLASRRQDIFGKPTATLEIVKASYGDLKHRPAPNKIIKCDVTKYFQDECNWRINAANRPGKLVVGPSRCVTSSISTIASQLCPTDHLSSQGLHKLKVYYRCFDRDGVQVDDDGKPVGPGSAIEREYTKNQALKIVCKDT